MRRRRSLVLTAALAFLVLSPAAPASNLLSDVNVKQPTLQVNTRGYALVSYLRQDGTARHVLAWGALNSNPPSQTVRQVRLRLDYSGGFGAFHNGNYWRTLRNACSRYDGPRLAYVVAACKAPDGSYWALQSWQRGLPLLGFAPWQPSQSAYELHVSHWTGTLARLEVYAHRTYGGQFQGLFGRLTYAGSPVYGFSSTELGNPNDNYGRNVYIDTFDSAYGPGWKRESAILVHNPAGTFCHSFVPQKPFPGYPSQETRPAAPGTQYRVTVIGPGVTPDLRWQGPPPPVNDAGYETRLRATFDRVMAGDARCAGER